jgi:hypothetical protein
VQNPAVTLSAASSPGPVDVVPGAGYALSKSVSPGNGGYGGADDKKKDKGRLFGLGGLRSKDKDRYKASDSRFHESLESHSTDLHVARSTGPSIDGGPRDLPSSYGGGVIQPVTFVEPLSKREREKIEKAERDRQKEAHKREKEFLKELEKKEKEAEAEDTVGRAIGTSRRHDKRRQTESAHDFHGFASSRPVQLKSATDQEPQTSPKSSVCASGSPIRRNPFPRMQRAQSAKSSSTVVAKRRKSPLPRSGCLGVRTAQRRVDSEVSTCLFGIGPVDRIMVLMIRVRVNCSLRHRQKVHVSGAGDSHRSSRQGTAAARHARTDTRYAGSSQPRVRRLERRRASKSVLDEGEDTRRARGGERINPHNDKLPTDC